MCRLRIVCSRSPYDRVVQALDGATGAIIATVPVTGGPEGLALSSDGKQLWTANPGANTLSVIDLAQRKVVATFPVIDGGWTAQ